MVVLAMGGLSFPAVGTDGTGYAIARRDLNHDLHEPYPALVPLTGDHPGGERLPGLSVDVSLVCDDALTAAKSGGAAKGERRRKPRRVARGSCSPTEGSLARLFLTCRTTSSDRSPADRQPQTPSRNPRRSHRSS